MRAMGSPVHAPANGAIRGLFSRLSKVCNVFPWKTPAHPLDNDSEPEALMSSAITTSGDQLAPPRPAIRDRRAVARTLLTIFIFPWIFDVRAQAGAEWLLVIQLLSFISTTVIFVVAIKVFKRRVDLG